MMKDLDEQLRTCYGKDLNEKRNWYGEVADAYNRVRPRYPQELIDWAIEFTKLPENASILELGCGPGNATVSFAKLGFSMICLEPNQTACRLAKQNCSPYPQVEIINTTFEEWELESEHFYAVLAANSLHWVSPQIRYTKTREALQEKGFLIALWNLSPQPSYEIYQSMQEVYQTHEASFLNRYEDRNTQEEILKGLGQLILESGCFKNLRFEQIPCKIYYSIDDYLRLLSTLSFYIALEPVQRINLLESLRSVLEKVSDGTVEISYLSAVQIAQKI
jgi:SAM-dependent methyltransferase